jgi:phosphatidylethanolamine-binding protein (PEBP) family uncharacterized protein
MQRRLSQRYSGPCPPDCPNRTRGTSPNCHSYCEKYLAYKKKVEDEKMKEYEGRNKESGAKGFLIEQSRKRRR